MYGFRRFVEEDEPLIGIVTGLPYYTPEREAMSLAAQVRAQYHELAADLGGLSEEQLARKARVPLLEGSPLEERVTLEQWGQAAAGFHVTDRSSQVRAVREPLGA
jgi:hypothetical protein